MDYRPLEMDVKQFVVDLPTLQANMTGPFPAKVSVRHSDNRQWNTAMNGCTVTVETHEFVKEEEFAKKYKITGRGECANPAMPSGSASGTVTISPFTFSFPPRFQ